jgi:membrane protease YdiL (CAAX protease family)
MQLFRPLINNQIKEPWQVVSVLLALHLAAYYFRWIDTDWIFGSMLIVWLYPFVFSGSDGRREAGIRLPKAWFWWIVAPFCGAVLAAGAVSLAWATLGLSDASWMVQYAKDLDWRLGVVPSDLHPTTKFWFLALPVLVTVPFAMEILYRGYIQRMLQEKTSGSNAAFLQAGIFTLAAQLFYTGYDADVVALWLPTTLVVAWMLGFIREKSESIWPGVLAHMTYSYLVMWFVYYHVL